LKPSVEQVGHLSCINVLLQYQKDASETIFQVYDGNCCDDNNCSGESPGELWILSFDMLYGEFGDIASCCKLLLCKQLFWA